MYIAKIDGEQRLDELVKHAENGEEVFLSRADKPVAKIVVLKSGLELKPLPTAAERLAAIRDMQRKVREKDEADKRLGIIRPTYQQVIDDMYDEDGLPR
jgi:antitoxin (DNA-binding transcriptional repressor) of toxin-antitoxin stability system